MSIRPTICAHCGAGNLPDQEVCEACGKRLSTFAALKPTIVSSFAALNSATIAGLGAVLGGISAVIPQFLLILLACPGLCDSPPFLAIFCPLAVVNFILGGSSPVSKKQTGIMNKA